MESNKVGCYCPYYFVFLWMNFLMLYYNWVLVSYGALCHAEDLMLICPSVRSTNIMLSVLPYYYGCVLWPIDHIEMNRLYVL